MRAESKNVASSNPISKSIRGAIFAGWLAALFWLERRRALRQPRESKLVRDLRNVMVAATAGATMQVLELPVAFGLANWTQKRHWGILPRLPLPPAVRCLLGILALDYTLYWWHFLTHRVPILWRFHQVHHIDLDMDATTALRFHFGEIALSVFFRASQILVIGPTRFTVAAWQIFLFACILFHHSNAGLPLMLERRLARLLVTPRLHGIHHSIEPDQVNSNWSSGLTIWDWLHGTLRTDVPQSTLVLGVKRFADPVRLRRLLALPFEESGQVPAYDHRRLRQPLDQLS